jgi:hypothetical protein
MAKAAANKAAASADRATFTFSERFGFDNALLLVTAINPAGLLVQQVL